MTYQKFMRYLTVLSTTFIGATLLGFFLIRIAPGDPVTMLLGERGATPEVIATLRRNLGLDLPLIQQYFIFLKNALTLDFGQSIVTRTAVTREFFARFPATVELSLFGLAWSVTIGIIAGTIAALFKNRWLDSIILSSSVVGFSIPVFWWALVLVMLFSVILGITPVSGRISPLFEVEHVTGFLLLDSIQSEKGFRALLSAIHHLLLPSLVIGTIPLAVITRITRASLLESLSEDFIRTARAKGLSTAKVLFKHGLRNALPPIITVIGLSTSAFITGAILTETIFSWPGIGKWLVASVVARDYPVVQGAIVFIAMTVCLLNQAIDWVTTTINPEARHAQL